MKINNQIVVECVGSIVNSIRETGTIEVVEPGKSPIETCHNVVYDCGCTNQEDLEVGSHDYTIISPNYMFGNKAEVGRIFTAKELRNESQYPLIVLEQPFVEVPGKLGLKTTIRLLFASFVPKDEAAGLPIYKRSYQERFKIDLYPLYNKFLKALIKSPIVKAHKIVSKIDRPLYGETQLISSDYWDAIDVRFEITFGQTCHIEVCEALIYGY